jgi:hypothetical protein
MQQRFESVTGWLNRFLIGLLIALLPFEFETVWGKISILQLTFMAVVFAAAPIFFRDWKELVSDRLLLAVFALVVVFWLSAIVAPEHPGNAIRGALRMTGGFVLLCIASRVLRKGHIEGVWCWAAVFAAAYGIADYLGFGLRSFFRTSDFYTGDVLRLSGSFEYPNTAGAFLAMSLPIVWSRSRPACVLLWSALLLTYSRGALIGLMLVLVCAWLMKRDKQWLHLAALGVVLLAVGSAGRAVVAHAAQEEEGLGAQYELKFNHLRAGPGASGTMPVTVRNTGTKTWENVVLSYHWFNPLQKRIVFVPERATPLPAVVSPGQAATVDAVFETPRDEGLYLLDWDLKSGDRWFSLENGIVVGIVEVTVEPGARLTMNYGDVSRWYRLGPGRALDATVGRLQLWSAAWTLIRKHPLLGSGPDNFRLLYGSALGYQRWDRNIHANSLYFELLTGCGVLGLLAFAAAMASVRWNMQPAALAVGVFLVHGIVDSFLMTTPIYFAFWLLLGTVHASRV